VLYYIDGVLKKILFFFFIVIPLIPLQSSIILYYEIKARLTLQGGVRKVPLKLVTGARRPVSVRQPSDLESGQEDAGATWWSVVGPSPWWGLFSCRSGTDAVFSSCCSWTTARYAFGDDGVDLQATTAGGTSPSRAANRSHILRATGSRSNESRVSSRRRQAGHRHISHRERRRSLCATDNFDSVTTVVT
jgi:hypothetical protein